MSKYVVWEDRDKNAYHWALEIGGAKVLAFNSFGTYQGDWYAKIEFNGKQGWVHGYYGTCEYCDAFDSEVGYSDKEGYEKKKVVKLAASYLSEIKTYEEVLAIAQKDASWDLDAKKAIEFIQKHR